MLVTNKKYDFKNLSSQNLQWRSNQIFQKFGQKCRHQRPQCQAKRARTPQCYRELIKAYHFIHQQNSNCHANQMQSLGHINPIQTFSAKILNRTAYHHINYHSPSTARAQSAYTCSRCTACWDLSIF